MDQGLENGTYLVAGRECGTCTACCVDLAIAADGMEKLPGIACEHCTTGAGCAIYAQRPQVCGDYHCLWRSLDYLDERWRPDRSGILMIWGEAPENFPSPYAVELILLGPPETLQTDDFASMVAGFIESGTATSLAVPHGPGFLTPNAFLNVVLRPAIAARNLRQVKELIWAFYEQMKIRPRVAITAEDFATSRSPQGWQPHALPGGGGSLNSIA